MKKLMPAIGFCLIALTACNNDNNLAGKNGNGIYQRNGNTINANTDDPELFNEVGRNSAKQKREGFGYVRLSGDGTPYQPKAIIDREKYANVISQYCTNLPNVDDVSTLVTDKDVLIVYKTNSKDRFKTADQVKRTAMSVVPRWFNVYVTDNTHLRQDVENFATLDVDSPNLNKAIDSLINRMKKSPQGSGLDGENENGETVDEQNDRIRNSTHNGSATLNR